MPTPIAKVPAIGYRDPSTGTCIYEPYGGGGGGQCCGDQPCAYGGDAYSPPDWGTCNSQCDALDESSCIETTACHAAYVQTGNATPTFLGCWQTSSARPPTSPCAGLDASGCDGRDDCSMVYTTGTGGQRFSACIAETTGSCGIDIGCPPGSHCAELCDPCNTVGCMDTCTPTCVADITCAQTDCGPGYQCVEECNALVGPCTPTCVPTTNPDACEMLGTESACQARSDCTPVYIGNDCTCTMTGGCTCATETYSRCESTMMPL